MWLINILLLVGMINGRLLRYTPEMIDTFDPKPASKIQSVVGMGSKDLTYDVIKKNPGWKKKGRPWQMANIYDNADYNQLVDTMDGITTMKKYKQPYGCYLDNIANGVEFPSNVIFSLETFPDGKVGNMFKGKVAVLFKQDNMWRVKAIAPSEPPKINGEKVKIFVLRETVFTASFRFSLHKLPTGQKLLNSMEVQQEFSMAKLKVPSLSSNAEMYHLQNILTTRAYFMGWKEKAVKDTTAYGCFLEKVPKPYGGLFNTDLLSDKACSTEKLEFKAGTNDIPFFINFPKQKYKMIYVTKDKDVSKICGMDVHVVPIAQAKQKAFQSAYEEYNNYYDYDEYDENENENRLINDYYNDYGN